jgi:hypothetical protein
MDQQRHGQDAGRIYMQMYREGRLVRGRLLSSRVVSRGDEREPSMMT